MADNTMEEYRDSMKAMLVSISPEYKQGYSDGYAACAIYFKNKQAVDIQKRMTCSDCGNSTETGTCGTTYCHILNRGVVPYLAENCRHFFHREKPNDNQRTYH